MKKHYKQKMSIFLLFALTLSLIFVNQVKAQIFNSLVLNVAGGGTTAPQCTDFENWRVSLLRTDYSVLNIRVNGVVQFSSTNVPLVQAMANTLRTSTTAPPPQTWIDGSNQWYIGGCGPGIEFGVMAGLPTVCNCLTSPTTATLRPCLLGGNWGGVGVATCGNSVQLVTIEFGYPSGFNDAGVVSIDSPAVFNAGNRNIRTTIRNFGKNQINPVTVNWSVNGSLQTPLLYTGLLDTTNGVSANTAQVNLGSSFFANNISYNIKAWTSLPNSVADTTPNNDTAFRTIRSPLSGNYTIGVLGDFPTITSAANALSAAGITGPVNFQFIDNEYNRSTGETFPITISAFAGMAANRPITFTPATGITPVISDSNSSALIILDGAKYITISGSNSFSGINREMVIQNRSISTSSNVIILRNEAIGNTLRNINFRSGNNGNAGGGAPAMVVIGGTTNVLGIGNDSNNIRHNTFSPVYPASIGFRYGKGIVVSGQSAILQNDNITIDSNYFYGFTHAAIYITETNSGNGANFNIRGNSLYDTALATIGTNNIYGIWFNPSNVNSVNNNITGNFLGGTSPFNGGTGAGLPKQSITHTGFWFYYGIFSNASVQGLTTIANNTIRNMQFNATSTGYFQGIYSQSGMLNILNNTVGHPADTNNMVFNGGGGNNCNGFSGIWALTTGISNIKNNIVSSFSTTELLSNTTFGIYSSNNNSANINIDSNVVSRMNIRSINTNTTTCAAFIGLVSLNSSPNVQIRGNIIGGTSAADSISLISPTPIGSRAMGIYITNGINTITNNRVQHMYTNSNAQFGLTQAALGGIYLQSFTNGQIMNNNYIGDFRNYGINGSTVFGLASVYGLASVSGAATINNNTIRDFYVTSTNTNTLTNANINGIVLSTSNIQTVNNNTITNLISLSTLATNAGGQINGIFAGVNNQATITNNNISRLIFNGPGAGTVFGINSSSGAANKVIDGNTITRLISTDISNNNQTLVGINFTASNALVGNNSSVSRNNIHSFGMDFPTSFFPTNSVQYGIQIGSGTATIANNLIRIGRDTLGNQTAKAGNFKGIYSTNTSGQLRIYHNNILVDCAPSYGAIFTGSLEVPFTPAASLFAFTDIRNNIFVNNSSNTGTATGNHYNVMYPTTLFQLLNGVNVYTVTSDFNLHFNTPSANNFTGIFAGLNFVDINSLRLAGPTTNLFVQESSSGYANPNFLNATGDASTVNLRLATTNPAESMGDTTVASFVTNDFVGVTRTGRPDIGASSGTFTLSSDLINPAIYFSNLTNAGGTGNRTFQATIYDAGLIGIGSVLPRVYFRKNQGAWSSSAGIFVSGSTSNAVYNFTIDHSALGGITLGDSVYYYVLAQDVSAGNINSRAPYAVASNVNTVTSSPLVAASYVYNDPIPNIVYIGTGSGLPSYPTLTGANGLFAAINNSVLTDNTTVLIQSNVTENGLVALNKWLESGIGNYTLTIRPAIGAGQVVVSGTSTTTLGMLRLVGTDRVNILGWSPIGTSADTNLIIRCSSTFTPALSFQNGGSNDTINGVIFESRNNNAFGTNVGTINLSPTTTTRGLSNLTFSNNYIRMDLTSTIFPSVGIYGQGTVPRLNTNIAVTGNHFINFTSNGVNFTTGTGNGMLVTGNHFYYNYGPIFTSTSTLNPIIINAGTTTDNNVISNNWIGGSAPFASGNNWTINSNLSFTGISLITGLTTGTTVNRNVIQKINFTSTTNTVQATGILVQGTAATYSITNNRVGSLTQSDGISSLANQRIMGIQSFATGNITITGDTISNIFVTNIGTIAGIFGISVGSGGSNITNISNNFVNRLITTSSNTSVQTNAALIGILLTSNSLSQTIANNRITTLVNQTAATHSMYGIMVSSGSNVVNNNFVYGLNSRSTATGLTNSMALSGIHYFASVTGSQTITNNTVDSVWMWTATPSSTQTSGISVFNTFGALTLTGNTVKNINSNTTNINALTTSGLTGILISCPSAVNSLISRNTVSVINHTHTLGAVSVIGMLVNTSASLVGNTTNVTRNFIHSLRSNSTGTPILTGLSNANGFATYANNMVRMGIDSNSTLFTNANTQRGIWHQNSTQSNYYHNTVLVSGAPAIGALNTIAFETQFQIALGQTLNLRNNIFANTASNSGTASGFHFGLRLQDSLRINSDYNIIFTPGTNGVAAGTIFANSRYLLLGGDSSSWKSRVRLDLTSTSVDPSFEANAFAVADLATLALNANNPAERSGDGSIVNVMDDFFGNIRANNSPSDVGAHAGNFSQTPDAFPPTITFTPFTNAGSVTGTRTLTSVVFTDNNGIVNSGLNRPKIYYTRDRFTWYSSGAINMSGTATNATADFVIDYLQFSPSLTISDSVIYFIVAQDNAGNVQSSAPLAVGTNVNVITQYPLVANQYKFLPTIPANTVLNVGVGQTYTTLTGVGGLFDFINGRTLGGNVSAEITSDLLGETGAIALNQFAEDGVGAGTFTLTIRPNALTTIPRLVEGAGVRIIALNGANRVKLTGIPTSGNLTQRMLRIRNTNATGVNILVNSATGVLLSNLIVENGNSGAAGAGIEFRVGTGALALIPCTFDTINNNFITNNTTATLPVGIPQNGIYMLGTPNVYHNNIVVSNNEVSNFMLNGFVMAGNGGDGYRITNNNFYYNLPIYTNVSGIQIAINLSAGSFSSGNNVSGNIIGGSAINAGGLPWTVNQTVGFNGISATVGNNASTLIQNNTIQNINFTNQTGFNQFLGIRVTAGNTIIGGSLLTGNLIGHPTITNSIRFSQQTLHSGILYFGTNNITITGNRVQGFFINAPALSTTFYGIDVQGGTVLGINNNTIGSATVANSVVNTGTNQTVGIIIRVNAVASPSFLVDGNTIANIVGSGTQPTIVTYGLFLTTTIGGNPTVTNNIINNISTNGTNLSTLGGVAVGLVCNVAASSIPTIRNNSINAIRALNNGTAATMATGLTVSSGQNATINGNRIYDITNASTSASNISPVPVANGIQIAGGNINNTIVNNQITIGTSQTSSTQFNGIMIFTSNNGITMNVFNNSVLVEGAASSGNQNSYAFVRGANSGLELITWLNLRNNVFANRRTGGSGAHYAISNQTGSPTNNFWNSSSSGHNLFVTANPSTIGQWGFSNNTIAQWRTNATSDELSYAIQSGIAVDQLNLDNLFSNIALGNLGIQSASSEAWYVFGKGLAGPAVNNLSTDYASGVREVILGFGNTLGSIQINTAPSSLPPAAIASSLPVANSTTSYTFANRNVASIAWGSSAPTTATLLNYTGVNAIGTAPSGNNLNQYLRLNVSGGTAPYNYAATINYDPALLGNVTSVNNLKLSVNNGGTLVSPTWITQSLNSVNSSARTIGSIGMNSVTGISAVYLTGTENAAPPTVLSFNPVAAPEGATITIRGTLFTGAISISFNGTTQSIFVVNSDTLITVAVPTGATTGPVSVTNSFGTGTSLTNFTVIPVPTITSINPITGTRGSIVTINGTGFTWATQVQFNGIAASYIIVNNTTITATVPVTGTTGFVSVVNAAGTAISGGVYTVVLAPTVVSFSPGSGAAGTAVLINGTNFQFITNVRFNGLDAVYTLNNSTQISAIVPNGATTGTITVVNGSGTGTSATNFIVLQLPTITGFSPSSGGTGTLVSITGTNFTGATAIRFNNVLASGFTVVNPGLITATVAVGTTSGIVKVTTPAGADSTTNSFTVIGDLIVSTTQFVSGTYNNVTVTLTGNAALSGTLTALGTVTIQSGGSMNLGNEIVNGAGAFVTQAGSRLFIGSPNGITSTGGFIGNIQVGGTRNFNSGAVYSYNGSVSQETGSGLPVIADSLTINNINGVSLSQTTTVNGRLLLGNGNLLLGNASLIVNGTIASASAFGYVVTNNSPTLGGSLRRTVANSNTAFSFPVGTPLSYTPAQVTLSVGSTSDLISVRVFNGALTNGSSGSLVTSNIVNRSWVISEAVVGGSIATINLTWDDTVQIPGFNRFLCGVARHNGLNWIAPPTYGPATGTNPFSRSLAGITALGIFSVGDNTSSLPVELTNLKAKAISNDALISWNTVTEINNNRFEVERSIDGNVFEYAGQIKGAGNSSTIKTYQFIDSDIAKSAATVYYRLKQIDFDGATTYFGPVQVNFEEKEIVTLQVEAYPNPFNGNLNVSLIGEVKGQVELVLMDVQGKIVKTYIKEVMDQSGIISLEETQELKDGIYILRANVNGSFVNIKVVKTAN